MSREPVLASKIRVPTVPERALWRARLSFSASQSQVVQLVAPVGYGKTLLVSQWAERQMPQTTVGWLSLDEEDNQDERLLRYLVAACSEAGLKNMKGNTPDYVLDRLARHPKKCMFVLDNCHVVADGGGAYGILVYLIKHCPANTQFVLLTRRELNWGLTRWHLVDKLDALTRADLAFTAEEITGLFAIHHNAVSIMKAQAIQEETGGWPAAVKILLSTENLDEVLRGESIASRDFAQAILSYIHDEALRHLSPEQLRFIYITVQVDIFSLHLAERITSLDRHLCSRTIEWLLNVQLIEEIEKDKQETWYRYWPLIVDALRTRADALLPIDTTEILQKASSWLDKNGYTNQSAGYAEQTQDYAHIVSIIERDWRSVFMGDNIYQVYRWIRLLPIDLLLKNPWISCIMSLAAFVCDDVYLSSLCERSATEHYLDPRNRQDPHYAEALALIANVLSLRADYQESQRLATRALELLPPSDFFLRQTASQAREYANPTIDYLSYRDMLLEYLPQVVAHGHQLYKANMFAFLADTEGNLGNLAAALEYIRCSVEVSDKNLHPERPTFMAIHRARMNVAYHRSSLGEAEIYRRQFEKVTKASYSFPSLALALAYAAFFSYLRGDLGQVEPCLKESLRLSPSGLLGLTPSLSFISYLEDSGLVDLRRYMDQLPPSFRKVREYKRMAFILPYVEGGVLPLDSLRRGVSAIESARRFDQVQGHILLALYEERAGQGEAAEQAMRKALAWAEPEQMSQVFLSDHEHVLPLVERLENTAEQSSFARSLRARLSQLATGEAKLEDDTEGQRLTMRENEVVYFLAAGYKLHEIAEQLGISKETVRKHIANSYRKLEVHSRTQLLLKLQ